MDTTDIDVAKSSSKSGFLVHDEWTGDDIPFPTKSDAFMATFALSKEADPIMIDKFLSLVKKPVFNPAECTLHSVADIHSYSCTFRKAIGNSVFEDSSLQTIPMFVWEEVLVRIGSQWVAFVHKLCDDAVQEVNAIGWERDIFERILVDHQSTIDLRCASMKVSTGQNSRFPNFFACHR